MSKKPDSAEVEEKIDPSKDRIGTFPNNYDTTALPERRTAAFARMAAVIAVVEACVIVALAFAIAALIPLQKVVPMVVTANDKGDEIVHINPASFESPTLEYITEINLRNYVTKRNSVVASQAEQAINWGLGSVVQLMSSDDVYQQFQRDAMPEYESLRKRQATRQVRIDSVRKLDANTWQVEWISTVVGDQSAVAAPPSSTAPRGQSQAWISTYEIDWRPQAVTYSQRLNNPFGMVVTSVSDARRD